MDKKSHHVVPDLNGGWNVKKGGSIRASKHFNNKTQAEAWAREISKRHRTELVIHNSDGTIQRKDSHANDPFPPQDCK